LSGKQGPTSTLCPLERAGLPTTPEADVMLDFIERAFVLGSAGWFLLITLGICAYTLISQMLDDHLQAMIGTPILMIGSALGHQLLKEQGVSLSSDKVISMGVGFMIGLVATAVLLVSCALVVNTLRGR
jgi:hypothetical protein